MNIQSILGLFVGVTIGFIIDKAVHEFIERRKGKGQHGHHRSTKESKC